MLVFREQVSLGPQFLSEILFDDALITGSILNRTFIRQPTHPEYYYDDPREDGSHPIAGSSGNEFIADRLQNGARQIAFYTSSMLLYCLLVKWFDLE